MVSGDISGVQGRKNEVACFGGHEGHGYCFWVSHFANKYDIWIFAEHGSQAVDKAFNISSQFALADDGVSLLENILDRVFDSDYAAGTSFVYSINQRGDGGALSGAGYTSDKNEALLTVYYVVGDSVGKTDILDRRDVKAQGADGGADAVVIKEIHLYGNCSWPSRYEQSTV